MSSAGRSLPTRQGTDELLDRIAREADALVAAGAWSAARDAQLDAAFEAAATAALRVPRFAERSRRLRAVARVVVPARLRPAVKRVARLAERSARALAARGHRG